MTRSSSKHQANRSLIFQNLDDAVHECQRLLDGGYERNGKWSLGQVCCHLRLTQDASMDGYPRWMSFFAPLRPIIRTILLPRLLRGDSPKGIRTAGRFVPPDALDDHKEVEAFAASVARFQQHKQPLHAHPGFGRFDHDKFTEIHVAHAAHHLEFLLPRAPGV